MKTFFYFTLLIGVLSTFKAVSQEVSTPQKKEPDPRILSKVIETGVKYEVANSGLIKFIFSTDSSRTQAVLINDKVIAHSSGDYMEIMSRVYIDHRNKVDPKILIDLMKKSFSYQIFFLVILETDDKLSFYVNARIPLSVSAVGLYRTLTGIANEADRIEKSLTRKDDY